MSANENEEVIVTVVVITYNQEEYIEQTIQSIVSQKTDFKYEVIIRDDASTDGTQDIIKKYHEMYPDKIIPVIHEYNHFSQNDYSFESVREYIRGKYCAYCEGDDFWTDDTKLQKEVDILESNPSCKFVAHKERCIDEDGNWMDKYYPIRDGIMPKGGGIIKSDEMARILLTVSLYPFQTASYLVPRDTFISCIDTSKKMFKITGVYIDIRLLFESVMRGDFYYIDETMGAYRVNARGSFSADISKSTELQRDSEKLRIKAIIEFDKNSNYKYHKYVGINFEPKYVDAFNRRDYDFVELINKNNRIPVSRVWSGEIVGITTVRSKIYWTFATHMPKLVHLLHDKKSA